MLLEALLKIVLSVLLSASAIWFFGELAWTVHVWRGELPALVDQHATMVETRLDSRAASIQAQASDELAATRKDLLSHFDAAVAHVDSRLGSLQDTAQTELQRTRADVLAELHPSVLKANDLLDAYTRVPAIVGGRLDPWTNCTGNGACWQAQFTASLGATRHTMGEIAIASRSFPELVTTFQGTNRQIEGIATDTHRLVSRWTAPEPLWKKLLGVGRDAAVIGRIAGGY